MFDSSAISGNTAWNGGGVYSGTLKGCKIRGNRATMGGGLSLGVASHCIIQGNLATNGYGGGVRESDLVNSVIIGNEARHGGAADNCTLQNCTVLGNMSSESAGGLHGGEAGNCIVFGNTAPSFSNHRMSALEFCCTFPDPGGVGNITNDPQFLKVPVADGKVEWSSACIDAGNNAGRMHSETDLVGNPRVFNGTVDMGAYEFTVNTYADTLLRGAYNVASGQMNTLLAGTRPPLTNAPYSADVSAASDIPSNTTDWLLLQLRCTNDMTHVASKSCFLRSDGKILNMQGGEDIRLECSPGHYYLVAKHRNHVTAMSAQPIAYTNSGIVSYDFTTGPGKYYGGTNACVQLSSNLWGMTAGDANGDGKITWVDRVIVSNQLGMTGYLQGDLNLDGKVDGND